MSTRWFPSALLFRGALYRRAVQVGRGQKVMTGSEVAAVLAEQHYNRGRVPEDVLKEKWVRSGWFILINVYPALPDIGVSPGKTGHTFSMGQPLIIDLDVHGVAAQNQDGSFPKYLVLDGQNRLVKLRREDPYSLYPAYVGADIIEALGKATRGFSVRVNKIVRGPRCQNQHFL